MPTRTLPEHDLKLIDDRRLAYQGVTAIGTFRGAAFQAEDGLGVIVSIDEGAGASAAYHISVTRPDGVPSDADLAVVRVAVCGPGSAARIITPDGSMLRGRVVHIIEEPAAFEPPDQPWWTPEEFDAWATKLGQTPADRDRYLATLGRLGLVRVYHRDDPERGHLVQVDLRALLWRDEWRERHARPGAGA